jgi:RNA polymerase sigma-70 factor (ECF subfamily)
MAGTPPQPDASDHSLLKRVRAGEQDAATALYLRYAGHLRAIAAAQTSPALATRVDPEDIVQSVFRTFFRRVGEDQYDVPAGDDLWRLFLVIALHKIRNAATHHRAAKRDIRQTVHIGDEGRRVEAAEGDETGLAVLRMVIDEALDRLPDGTRRIVELRIDGHEVAEIADRVGRSKRSVERVLQQFRDEVRGLLHEDR